MRIAEVCPKYYPSIGGVETHVKNISERLAKENDLSVFTTDPSGRLLPYEVENLVKITRFKSWAPNESYYFCRNLKKYLLRNSREYDVVHAHSYHAFPSLYAAQTKDINRFVFTPHYHGGGHTFFRNLLHKPYKLLARKVFEKADKIVCVSNFEKDLIQNRFGIDNSKVAVIPNGVSMKEFEGLERRKRSYKVILYVGRLERYKGVNFLINALAELDNDVILEIVGKGPYKRKLIKLATKLGVQSRVRFFQNLTRSELLEKYAGADIFALLSEYEAFGISLSEALASEIPAIVADTSALREWIDGKNCFGVSYPVEIDELARLIRRVIGKKVGPVKLWDWDEVAQKIADLYNDIV